MTNEEGIRKWRDRRGGGSRNQEMALHVGDDVTTVRSEFTAAPLDHSSGASFGDVREAILDRRNSRRKLVLRRLALFVAVPLLVIGLYIGLIATPLFRGEAVFTVQTSSNSAPAPTAGLFALAGGSSTIADAFKAREFILSRPMMEQMQKRYGFLDHFASAEMDPLTRFDSPLGLNRDPFNYYLKRVSVAVDVQEGILRLYVQARSKEDAIRFGNAILAAAEAQVNQSSEKIGSDQIDALTRDVQRAEIQVSNSRRALASVQARRGDLSPEQTATSIYQLISNLELQLAEADRQRNALVAEGLTNSPLLPSLDARSRELRSQIAEQRSRLANPTGGALAGSLTEYEGAAGRKEIAQARWESTLNTLQQAYLQVLQQRRYFVIVVGMSAGSFAKVRDPMLIAIPILSVFALIFAVVIGFRNRRKLLVAMRGAE